MPRMLSLLTLVAALVLVSNVAAAKDIDREKLNPVIASIVKVEAITDAGGYSLGSAVSIAPGRFVTSCHVTAHAVRVDLLYEGLRWPAVTESSDTGHDACVLEAPSLARIAPVKMGNSHRLKVGQSVAAMGYTFGAGLAAQTGEVSALHPFDDSVVIQSTTPFNSGASGGGLFDEDGYLVGILTFRLPGADSVYFSIPVDWINPKLTEADSFTKIAPLSGPRPFWAQPRDALPFFMRATRLESSEDWEGLIQLTAAWTEAEPMSAEAWLVRGKAYRQLKRADAAIKSFDSAVKRDPELALAWFNIADIARERGDTAKAAEALAQLRPLDSELANQLETTISAPSSP